MHTKADLLAHELSAVHPAARAAIKALIIRADRSSTDELLEAELSTFRAYWDTQDVRSTLRTFLKMPPPINQEARP